MAHHPRDPRPKSTSPTRPSSCCSAAALDRAEGAVAPTPAFAHLPWLVNEQRKKLSKRRDPVAVESYRDQGYLAEAMINFLGLLGWSPKGDEEMVDVATMLEQFALEDVNHSPAFFDVAKLTHLNGAVRPRAELEAFIDACRPWVEPRDGEWAPSGHEPPWPTERFDAAVFARIAPLVQERVATLGEVCGDGRLPLPSTTRRSTPRRSTRRSGHQSRRARRARPTAIDAFETGDFDADDPARSR